MGSLKPGATYVYERVDNVTYAREIGAPPESRVAIGWDYPYTGKEYSKWAKEFTHNYMWSEIFEAAEHSPALQEALERVKIIYYLSKEKNGT